jgi:hypothetical protein
MEDPKQAAADAWPLRRAAWLLGLSLAPFVLLAFYAHPEADDYVFASVAREQGFFASQRWWYAAWTGRFFSTAVLSAFPLATDLIRGYSLVPPVLLLAHVAALWAMLRALGKSLPGLLPERAALPAAVALTALYVTQMPSPREGFYWLAGAITYELALVLAMLLAACGLSVRRGVSAARRTAATVVCALLAVAVAGSNETMWLPGGAALAVAAGVSLRRRHPAAIVWGVALLAFLAGAAAVYAAPGNAARLDYHAEKPPLLANLAGALWTSARFALKWALRPALLGAAILAIPWASRAIEATPWASRVRRRHVLLAVAVLLGVVLLGFLPAYLSIGRKPPVRAQNPIFFAFLASGVAAWLLGVAWRRNVRGVRPTVSTRWRFAGAAATIVGLLGVGNLPRAACELAVEAPQYHRQMEARYAAMRRDAHAGLARSLVAPLGARPRSISEAEIGDDAYQDQHLAWYFGLESVALRADQKRSDCSSE